MHRRTYVRGTHLCLVPYKACCHDSQCLHSCTFAHLLYQGVVDRGDPGAGPGQPCCRTAARSARGAAGGGPGAGTRDGPGARTAGCTCEARDDPKTCARLSWDQDVEFGHEVISKCETVQVGMTTYRKVWSVKLSRRSYWQICDGFSYFMVMFVAKA